MRITKKDRLEGVSKLEDESSARAFYRKAMGCSSDGKTVVEVRLALMLEAVRRGIPEWWYE